MTTLATGPTGGQDLFLGVEVGTQSLAALVVDEAGRVIGRGSRLLISHRHRDGHEQDPHQWWQTLGEAVSRALVNVPAEAVRGIGICGAAGGFLLCDRRLRPVSPAVMPDDLRAQELVAEVAAADPGRWARLGLRVDTDWVLPRLLWLLRHGPARLRNQLVAGQLRLVHGSDYLAARLVRHPVATDWSQALRCGYDPELGSWPGWLPREWGVPPEALPEVVAPGARIGRVSPEGAAHTGLAAGTPVFAGMTSGCAGQIAAGAVAPGTGNSVLGPALVVRGVSPARFTDPDRAVYAHRHPDQGWLLRGASRVGTRALRGFNRVWLADRDQAARRYEPASGVVLPLPGQGEVFPFLAPDAKPFELGEFVDEDDRYAAHLQSVAFLERLAYHRLARLGAPVSGPVIATGGAARSEYWCQIRADVLGRGLQLPAEPAPSMGVAVLAAAAAIGEPLTDRVAAMVRVTHEVLPRRGADRFDDAYERFVGALWARGYLHPAIGFPPAGHR